MQAFAYASPTTVKEAVSLLADRWGVADVLAGGTDLLNLLKDYIHTPQRVVSIRNIKELGGIRKTAAGLRIGATVTLTELLASPEVRAEYPSLIQAARGVNSPQIRNMGTVGGDLCQRPRCWYFRQGFGLLATKDGRSLAKEGDNRYHAIFGNQGLACFVSASSFGPPLAALNAKVKLVGPKGERELPVEQFFVIPKSDSEREIALRPDEILTEILVPPATNVRNATYEVRQRETLDWPLVTASVALTMKGTTVASARVFLGHVAPIPWRAAEAEKVLAGKGLTTAVIEKAAEAATAGATPLSKNAYKVQLVRAAVRRALEAARPKA
ncbi:MAG: xanthine dehydrogenase family protein subunit M [Bryobacterales bacterium]|nr:xanthine dehydrogenase family protein subunit M [Bryobacteraceae bacterium]MDW8130001.1 xanthine dehydrogenase family protein subunit M [Bryobacterales bacterium]